MTLSQRPQTPGPRTSSLTDDPKIIKEFIAENKVYRLAKNESVQNDISVNTDADTTCDSFTECLTILSDEGIDDGEDSSNADDVISIASTMDGSTKLQKRRIRTTTAIAELHRRNHEIIHKQMETLREQEEQIQELQNQLSARQDSGISGASSTLNSLDLSEFKAMEKQAEFEISKEKPDQFEVPQSPISKMVDLFLNVREYLS